MTYLFVKFKLKRHFKNLIKVFQESPGIIIMLHPEYISEETLLSLFDKKATVKIEYIEEKNAYSYTLFF